MDLPRQIPDLSVGSDRANGAIPETPLPSTSAFADIKRMIDEPEWEPFRQDLSLSDFERIRVAPPEPEACSDEENDLLACGSGTKNLRKWKRSENSSLDHADSPSPGQKSKRVKIETEQSMETCEPEMDTDSGNLALTRNGLKLGTCFVKNERLALDSYSNAICLTNNDVRKRIKQEPEWSSVLESSVPTLDSGNDSCVALNENCDRGMAESVQDSTVNDQASSIVSEKQSHKMESESLIECLVRDDRVPVSSSEEFKCVSVQSKENVPAPSSSLKIEEQKLHAKCIVQPTDFTHEKSIGNSVAQDSDPTFSNTEVELKAEFPVIGNFVSSSTFRPDDNDDFSPKVSSEDGDSSDEDFEPDEQLSGDDDLTEDLTTDEHLIDNIKSNPLFKPFCESELESLAPEVLKHWKTKGFARCGVKSAISSYITQEQKYLQILKMYVYDGIDENVIRSLPIGFRYGSERFYLRVKCPVCCKIVTKRIFENHMNNHANRRPYKCERCGRGYLSEMALITHEKESRCSGKPFKCKVCSKTYECKPGLRLHEKSHDPNRKMHKCHVCEAVFALPACLKEHVARHTNTEDPSQLAKLFQCHICGKQFATRRDVNQHHSQIHLEKARQPKECKKCHAQFETAYQYHKHVQFHKNGTEKPLKCPHCHKRFAVHRILKNHMMTHTGEKPHKCDICGHAFTQQVALNKHKFTHQGRKPYRCDKCGKDSQRKQDIIEHKCPLEKSSKMTKEGGKDPVPAPVSNKARNLSATKKKKVFRGKINVSNETSKCKDVRRSLRSKLEKVSYKEHLDDGESSLKVSSEDGDSSDEDFEPDEQLSDDEVEDDKVDTVICS